VREIKFRVWGLVAEDFAMLPVSQLSWDEHDDGILRLHFCGCLGEKMQGSFGVHSGFGNVDGSEETGWTLMQYTGLKDENGKEIYEGDLVTNLSRNHNQPHPIVFSMGKFLAEYGGLQYDFGNEIDIERIEVIGNIYENPELVKEA